MYDVVVYSNLIDLHVAVQTCPDFAVYTSDWVVPAISFSRQKAANDSSTKDWGSAEGCLKQSPLCILLDRGGLSPCDNGSINICTQNQTCCNNRIFSSAWKIWNKEMSYSNSFSLEEERGRQVLPRA